LPTRRSSDLIFRRNTQLKNRLRGTHKLLLINSQQRMEGSHRRDGRLTHANRANLLGLNKHHFQQLTKLLYQGRRCHPSRSTTASYHYFFYAFVFQSLPPTVRIKAISEIITND